MKQLLLALLCVATVSCRQSAPTAARNENAPAKKDPLAIVLASTGGTNRIDAEITRLQKDIRAGKNVDASVERLGWAFVAKARESFDPGFYKLAEQCALALEQSHADSLEARLLRGHVLHNLHRFKEAEPLARELVEKRGLPYDFGLLSDVLMEQGRLDEAAAACQTMIDLRPDLHSYARGAHLRWLKGNVTGARDLMAMAATATSPRDPESAAWVYTRLAGYQFQAGDVVEAGRSCALALDYEKDYPPALLLRGRMLLAAQQPSDAVVALQRSVEINPLPEYEWTLAEALIAAGLSERASVVEARLRKTGAAADPRTYSLYLATRNQVTSQAVQLAQAELNSREDVFTHDALGWALLAAGKAAEAYQQSVAALSQGTRDARIYLHAALSARAAGHDSEAADWAARATAMKHTLLPCERARLESAFPVPSLASQLSSSQTDLN